MLNSRKPLGLYIHIPFCKSKCEYCDFCSFVPNSQGVVEHYTDALILQMEDWSDKCRKYGVDSVYFGGGTPTYLDTKHLIRIINAVYDNFRVSPKAEISMECNPATADFKELRKLRRAGVNRLSIGLQSANDNELRALGRIHSYKDFEGIFQDARKAGFENISVDLMYGIPDQTEKSFAHTLSAVTALGPDHLSLYSLNIEPCTPFADKEKELALPDEDTEYSMYSNAVRYLAAKGYERYEISNFAKPGQACLHNLKYWHCDEYLGLGASAHSYFGGERIATTRNVRDYIDGLEIINADINIVESSVSVNSRECMDEYVMLGMRLEEGVNAADFEARFGTSFEAKYGKRLAEYEKDGFVAVADGNYRFTTDGMFVSNYILSGVLDLEGSKE